MPSSNDALHQLIDKEYEHGFVTEIESETFLPGLNEDVIRALSAKKMNPNL